MNDGKSAIRWLLAAHYHLMDNPRFWYDKGIIEASKILCVLASDERARTKEA